MSQLSTSKSTGSPASKLARPLVFNQNHHKTSPAAKHSGSRDTSEASSSNAQINTDDFKIGDRVWVGGVKPGIIAFIGEVQFASGEWAGVVLDSPMGKNDGSVNGLRYFMCEPKRGIFSTLLKLTKTYIKNFNPVSSDAKNQSETRSVDSSDNQSEKSQKSTEQKQLKKSKDILNTIEPDIRSNSQSADAMSTSTQSATSEAKTSQSELKTSFTSPQSTNSALPRRKTSIGSSSSHSSGKNENAPALNLPFKIGDVVLVSGSKEGTVRFIGEADFAKGVWIGVELNEAMGKNDGSVAGKRYFHCAPMRGLFAPVHKVEICKTPTRSPLQQQQRAQQRSQSSVTGNVVSHSSSHNSSFNNNRGSQESISSIGSAASSASRRMKLGVTSLGNHMTRSKGSFYNTPTLSALQKTLKEKEEHIEQLVKERDLDRSEFIRTAAQIDEVESQLMLMQAEKKRLMEDVEGRLRQAEELIFTLEGKKNDLRMQLIEERRKYEDLQFTLEEANIEKSDIQSQIEKDARRLKELDEKLKKEMHLNEKLSNEIKSLKMMESNKEDSVDEYLDQIEDLTHKLCMAENKIRALESEGIEVKSVDLCRNCFQSMSSNADENRSDTVINTNDHHPSLDSKTLKNQLRSVTQEKLFVEAQKQELEEDFKKVSAERDLIELELNNLVEDHKKMLGEKEKLTREKLSSQKLIHEAGIQIKDFEQKVEKLTSDYAFRIEGLKKRAEAAEMEVQVLQLSVQQLTPLKEQVERLSKQLQGLTKEKELLFAGTQKLKNEILDKKQNESNQNISQPTDDKLSKTIREALKEKDNMIEDLQKEVQRLQAINKEAEQSQQRIEQLEKMLKDAGIDENNKKNNNITGDDNEVVGCSDINKSLIGHGASLIEKLKSEKDFAESQIDFLNAVIVDLQKKTTDLENRLQTAESQKSMTDSTLETLLNSDGTRSSTMRLFCDICDIFDQHDTEDCPKQNMTQSPMNASQYHGSKDEERPYCTTCEVFGHTTEQCKDEQTY